MRRARAAALAGAALWVPLWLAGCAPLRDPWGLALRRGAVPASAPALPDSLQADLAITPREAGAPPFSVRIYARPYRAYRVDAIGFPSIIVASYLWKDGRWTWVRHDRKQVREGAGDALELEGSSLRLPDVHAILGFLWGRPLPGFLERDSLLPPGPGGEIRWSSHGETWSARLDPETGLCREVRSATLSMRYDRFERRGGRLVPAETEVFVEGESVLLLRIRDLNEAPAWRKNPFLLAPPASYERL